MRHTGLISNLTNILHFTFYDGGGQLAIRPSTAPWISYIGNMSGVHHQNPQFHTNKYSSNLKSIGKNTFFQD